MKACPEPGRRAILAALAGFGPAVALVACGGTKAAKTAGMPPVAPQTDAAGALPSDPRSKIEALEADIKANLDRLQVPDIAPWSPMIDSSTDPRPMAEIRSVCTPPPRPSETCGDVCKLGSHICDNADQICILAAELQPDQWATGKCEDGKKSCEAARKRCCDCL